MTPTECVKLVKAIGQLCPAQKINDETPDHWFPLLADLPLSDSVQAMYAAKRGGARFVDVTDILEGVAEIRRERLAARPEPPPPAELAEDPVAYRAWQRNYRRAVAAGRDTQELTA